MLNDSFSIFVHLISIQHHIYSYYLFTYMLHTIIQACQLKNFFLWLKNMGKYVCLLLLFSSHVSNDSSHDGNMYEILRFMRCKNRNIYIYIRQRKIITHKTWFGNLPTVTELQWFHYSQEKIQSTAVQFSLSKQHKILEGVWYMHLKTCVLLFENICEKMYENTYNVI